MRKALLATFFTFALSALGTELTPELQAKIQRDQAAALDKVNAAHANKKSSEMDTAERHQVIQEQAKAQSEVLDKVGVDNKAFARYTAKMGLGDRKRAADETTRLEAEAAAAKEKERTKSAPTAPGTAPALETTKEGIVIERGTTEAKKAAADAEKAAEDDAKKKKHHRRHGSNG